MNNNSRMAWDGWHILGSCVLVCYFNIFLSIKISIIIVLFLGLLWEFLDELAKRKIIKFAFLDKYRGFDIYDMIRNIIGIILSLPIVRG